MIIVLLTKTEELYNSLKDFGAKEDAHAYAKALELLDQKAKSLIEECKLALTIEDEETERDIPKAEIWRYKVALCIADFERANKLGYGVDVLEYLKDSIKLANK
jgi:hypothetical protein